MRIAVVGLGYWGPNYLRNFIQIPGIEIKYACDINKDLFPKLKRLYPNTKFTTNIKELIEDESLNAVAIATPPESHFRLASVFLKAKKHVIVAKPMTETFLESKKLLELAKKNKVNLACDLTYIYTGSVKKISELIKTGSIGIPIYYDSIRTNLGLIKSDSNVVSDLLPHDLSILMECFDLKAKSIHATGSIHLPNSNSEETASIVIKYDKNFTAYIHVSWITPIKMRIIQIGGSKKMVYFDDVAPDEKVKIYDMGVSISGKKEITPFKPIYRTGDVTSPKIQPEEALLTELKEFTEESLSQKFEYKTAKISIEIAKILSAAQKSLKTGHGVNL
jgi:predicted dehydrogenase